MGCPASKSGPERQVSKEADKQIRRWMKNYKPITKLLLLGPGESGKTTIIKQMKILHVQGFSDDERRQKISEIRRNVLEAIKEICGNMAFLRPPVSLGDPALLDSLNFIRELTVLREYHYPQEFYEHTLRLWNDEGVQTCFHRSNEYQLIDSAKYFLDRTEKIRSDTYWPSDQDILCCRTRTSDIQKIEFEVSQTYGKPHKFWMFDVGGQRGERRKWIQAFDGITAVLFLAACSAFDSTIREDNRTNRLEEALTVFEEVWFSRFLRQSGFILFLNKQDVLEEKIRRGARVEDYFPDYADFLPPSSEAGDHADGYIKARSYFRQKFLNVTCKDRPSIRYSAADLYYDRSGEQSSRKCYWHYTTATDTDNIQKVFSDVEVMIISTRMGEIGANLS